MRWWWRGLATRPHMLRLRKLTLYTSGCPILSIHCSMGSAPVGVQRPVTSSLGEFPGYLDWFWYPGLSPMSVSIAFRISVFFHSLFFSWHWISFVFHLYDWCICTNHPSACPSLLLLLLLVLTGRLHLLTFRWVSRLGAGSGTLCCGPRRGAGVNMKQKSHFKFMPWLRFEPQTLQSDGCKRYH